MTAGTLLVAGIVAFLAIVAICMLVRDRMNGKGGCGCDCTSCGKCSSPNVTFDEGHDENRRGEGPRRIPSDSFLGYILSLSADTVPWPHP